MTRSPLGPPRPPRAPAAATGLAEHRRGRRRADPRLGDHRRRCRLLAGVPSEDLSTAPTTRGHRRRPQRPRGEIVDRRQRSSPPARSTQRRAVPRVPRSTVSPSSATPAAAGTAGLERSYNAALTGLNDPDPIRNLLKKFQADPYDPRPCPRDLAAPPAGGRRRPRRRPGRGRHARSAQRRGARAGLDPAVRRVGDRQPARPRTRLRGRPGQPRPAAADPAAGPLRAGLGVQDRDRGRRPRVRGDRARTTFEGRPRPSATASSSTASGSTSTAACPPRRSTSSAPPRSRRTSGSRSPASRPAATT